MSKGVAHKGHGAHMMTNKNTAKAVLGILGALALGGCALQVGGPKPPGAAWTADGGVEIPAPPLPINQPLGLFRDESASENSASNVKYLRQALERDGDVKSLREWRSCAPFC